MTKEFDGLFFVSRHALHNELDIGRDAKKFDKDIGASRHKLALEEDNVSRMSFQRDAKLFQGVRLRYHANIILKGYDFTDASTVDRLRMSDNKSDDAGLTVVSQIVQCFHCAKVGDSDPTETFPTMCNWITNAL